jgi:hypothetical protein
MAYRKAGKLRFGYWWLGVSNPSITEAARLLSLDVPRDVAAVGSCASVHMFRSTKYARDLWIRTYGH